MIEKENWQIGNPDEPQGTALIYFDGDIRGVSINLTNSEPKTRPLVGIDQDTLAELVEDASQDGYDVIRLGESKGLEEAYMDCALEAAVDVYKRGYFTALTQSASERHQP